MTSAGPSAPLLALEGLSIHYGRVQALEHVSLEVRAGEVVTLIGANGAGKSTTLRSISRIVPIYRGRIAFDGRDISGVRPSDAVRLGIVRQREQRSTALLLRRLTAKRFAHGLCHVPVRDEPPRLPAIPNLFQMFA